MKKYLFVVLFAFGACTHDVVTQKKAPENGGFPPPVADIFIRRCATSGCHNDVSKDASSGLSLTTWDNLFKGNSEGASVVPFRPDNSTLFFSVNTFSDLGPMIHPTMPYGGTALSREEVLQIQSWIKDGARNINNEVKFADNPSRKKIYVANQGCDLVTVFDAASGLVMRAIDVGNNPNQIESPHMIKVSPDGQYWYVVFYTGNIVQRFSTIDDHPAGMIDIGPGSWNTIAITEDSKHAMAVDWSGNGKVAYLDLEKMSVINMIQGTNLFYYPHGITFRKDGKVAYITAQTGNYIYKVDVTDPESPDIIKVTLDNSPTPLVSSVLDPHEIVLSPDEKYYYVSCQKSNDIRVMSAATDKVVATIPTGYFPQEVVLSPANNYLFVTLPEDSIGSAPGTKGSVLVIDTRNNSVVKSVTGFFQPHGIAVDEQSGIVYIANRNKSLNGPAPHHTSACGGKNGFMRKINLSSLTLDGDYSAELSVDPYSVAIRK